MTRVILNLFDVTYTNAENILTWQMEDKNTFPFY